MYIQNGTSLNKLYILCDFEPIAEVYNSSLFFNNDLNNNYYVTNIRNE